MKTIRSNWIASVGIGGPGLLLFTIVLTAREQTPPVFNIAPAGTNQFSIAFTNRICLLIYDLQWSQVLANPNNPWTFAAIGLPGGTYFPINEQGYQTAFFSVN